MKKMVLGAVASCLLTLIGSAAAIEAYGENSAEQTASSGVEATKDDEIERLNKACGTQASASINWKAYAAFSEADLDGRTRDNAYLIAGNQALDVLGYITSTCGSDALFKNNVAKKLKSITFTPTKGSVSVKNPSHTFQLNGGNLVVHYNFQTSDSSINNFKSKF